MLPSYSPVDATDELKISGVSIAEKRMSRELLEGVASKLSLLSKRGDDPSSKMLPLVRHLPFSLHTTALLFASTMGSQSGSVVLLVLSSLGDRGVLMSSGVLMSEK